MRFYRVMWSLVVVCLAALGVAEALLVVPPLQVSFAGVLLAIFGGLCHLVARRRCLSSTGTMALVVVGGASLGVAMTGLTALLGGLAGVLLVVLACTHPYLVQTVARRAPRRPSRGAGTATTSAARPKSPAPPPWLAAPPARQSPEPACEAVSRTLALDAGWPDGAALQRVSTAQLCWGWRASFTALERADPRHDRDRWSALIAVRQRYLDELARREPAGFARWLYAGARPASDPTRYLRPHHSQTRGKSTEFSSITSTPSPSSPTAVTEPGERQG